MGGMMKDKIDPNDADLILSLIENGDVSDIEELNEEDVVIQETVKPGTNIRIGFAWVTLATNDSYALGALVLAHSLRRAGTPHDLVALITPGVSAAMRNQLSSVFTLIQEVNVLDSRDEAHLALLERPELGITFTKLHCWRLTQYEKCVFLDADTLILKNSDELFEREELSAAPDPGWPDCFNSGVFVYRPSLDTFNALIKFALSKGSFDGGDQGLLNLFFSDWATKDISRHLPFIYNMVSTATYSYLPAYKQFGENAKIVHFIGANKPWLQYFDSETRLVRSPPGAEHLQPLLQMWWDIFCSTVHPSLSPEMLGLAGALAQLTLGTPRSAEQAAFEEHMRRQAWEQGNMDYMGRDSFDNIWRKITETLAQAPQKPEVPPTKSASEPKLPESKVPEPKSRKSPPTGTAEAPGLTSSAVEPTHAHESSKGIETPSDTIPSPAPSAPTPSSENILEEENSAAVVPHTPSIIEATPPTSPPIIVPTAPIADIQALKVDALPPDTPPVGSVPLKLVPATELTTEQTPKPPTSVNTELQSLPITESSELEQPVVIEQKKSAETIEAPCQDPPVHKGIIPTQEQVSKDIPISLEAEKVTGSTASEVSSLSQVSAPKESPIPSGDEKVISPTLPIPEPSDDQKVASSTLPIPVPSDDEKVVDSTVPEASAVTQISVPSSDGKVVASAIPEIPPPTEVSVPKETPEPTVVDSIVPELQSPEVSAPKEILVSPDNEKVVGSVVPELAPSLQMSASKITSESVSGENVDSAVPEVPVSSPSQVSVASEKVVSSTATEVSPPSQESTPKETSASVEKGKVVGSTISEVFPSPSVSESKEILSLAEDEKLISPSVPEIPPSSQISDHKETAESVKVVPEVQPEQKQMSVPEQTKKSPSTPIVAEERLPLQASAPKEIPLSPSDKAATPLVEAPTSQESTPKEEEKLAAASSMPKEIPTKSAAPAISRATITSQVPASPAEKEVPVPQQIKPELPVSAPPHKEQKQATVAPQVPAEKETPLPQQVKPELPVSTPPLKEQKQATVKPQVPGSPAEKEVPVPQQIKPELPVSAPQLKEQKQTKTKAVPTEVSKTQSEEKLDSKEPKSSEKHVSEELKATPASTSPTKTKDVSKPAGKKPIESKEPTQLGSVSPPQTPDAPPSEQAPVPPKRRGHKSASAAPGAEVGASSKPSQPQPQQTKGSKPGPKGKK